MTASLAAHEHVVQHLLDHPKIPGIPDKIGAVLGVPGPPKWHVVAQNIVFHAMLIGVTMLWGSMGTRSVASVIALAWKGERQV